jgi:hypothetical protein
LPLIAGGGQMWASRMIFIVLGVIGTPRLINHGPLLTRPVQVERIDLECDRDAETGHLIRCYQPRKES